MKRCPECRRDYFDDSLLYCLDDGAILLEGPAEPVTAILPGEERTKALAAADGRQNRADTNEDPAVQDAKPVIPKPWAAGVVLFALVVGIGGLGLWWFKARSPERPSIKTLAILPLRSIDADDDHLGLGIADTVIGKISQTGQLTVRPVSAVRRYLKEDTDALTAAKQLNADAVLDGSLTRNGDKLRVSVNLLRASDGASLWAQSFDRQMSDIFTIQDTVAEEVASRLQVRLNREQQIAFGKHYTSSVQAFDLYSRGLDALDQRMAWKDNGDATISFFQQAVNADQNFALAHAQLGYACVLRAVFYEPTVPSWAERGTEELNKAEALDPDLAELHLGRYQLLYSQFGDWQTEAAIRELFLANKIDPQVGHVELAYLYTHLGLIEDAERELQIAGDIDPTSDYVKGTWTAVYELCARYDDFFAVYQRFGSPAPLQAEAWYYMGKGRLDDAQHALDEQAKKNPRDVNIVSRQAVLNALKGDFRNANELIPAILAKHPTKDPFYHHATYDIAEVYALQGDAVNAVHWMKEAASSGFPSYTLYQNDHFLDKIRSSPEFTQFMSEMQKRFEENKRAFARQV